MTPQDLWLSLIKEASFNDFNGKKVVADLKANVNLWKAVIMDRDNLVKLRDLQDGYWNVDTLYITPQLGKEQKLYDLAKKWGADSQKWLGGDEACGELGSYSRGLSKNQNQVLVLWWD